MPGGDRTGPAGMGPMTGREAGYCAGYSRPGYANPGGSGRGAYSRGRGRGFRHRYYATGLPHWARGPQAQPAYGTSAYDQPVEQGQQTLDEKEVLKNQAEALREQLANIERRLEDLEEN